MMKKCIFVKRVISGSVGGVPIVDERNYQALSRIYDVVTSVEFRVDSTDDISGLSAIGNKLKRIFTPDKAEYKKLLNEVQKDTSTSVFFSSSKFGPEVKALRKLYPQFDIKVFFHNVETEMSLGRLRTSHSIKGKAIESLSYFRNWLGERWICRQANSIYVLNERDRELLLTKTSVDPVLANLLPMSIIDRCPDVIQKDKMHTPIKLLFVGTAFWANLPGVKEFIVKCMPKLKEIAEFYVVGRGMDSIRQEMPDLGNVHYIGSVSSEELDNYYRICDISIVPVTMGGGKK